MNHLIGLGREVRLAALLMATVAIVPPGARADTASQAPPDLSGTWYFADDATPSPSYQGMRSNYGSEFTIRQTAGELTFEHRSGQSSSTSVFVLDGALHENTAGARVTRSRARWEGPRFVADIEFSQPDPNDQTITTVSRRTLWREGDVLISEQEITSPVTVRTVSHYRQPPASPPPAAPPATASIDALAWLAGTWVSPEGGPVTEERWTPPAGGAMLGTSRTVAGTRMVAFEFLRIVSRDGGLVYVAQPGGREPTEFVLTHLDDEQAVFENPSHDYPKIIRYTRGPDDTLVARISDVADLKPQEFPFRRQRE